MEGGWRRYLEARGAPAGLVEIIDTCVAPPEQRYVDAGALLAALESCATSPRPAVEKPSPKPRPKAKPEPTLKPRPTPKPTPGPAAQFCHRCGTRDRKSTRLHSSH